MSSVTMSSMPRRFVNFGDLRVRPSAAALLLMTIYPLFLQVANYPIPVLGALGGTRSLDLYFLSFALIVTLVCVLTGSVRLVMPPLLFTTGALLWLGMNLVSMIVNQSDPIVLQYIVAKFTLKVAFAFMFLWVAYSSGQLQRFMILYVAGCFLVGLLTYGFVLFGGSLAELRGMSFIARDVYTGQADDISAYRGLVRQGAGNVMPIYIMILFLLDSRKGTFRTLCLTLLPYFVILAVLPLRREVLLDAGLGSLLMLPFAPRRYRGWVLVSALVVVAVTIVFVGRSQDWFLRGIETLRQWEAGNDPRLVMLRMGPSEVMDAPLCGHGPASFMFIASKYFRGRTFMAAHNSFLRAAIETGIPGLIGMLMMYGSLVSQLLRTRRQSSDLARRLWLFAALTTLHVGVTLNIGDGVIMNVTWMWIGLTLYAFRLLSQANSRVMPGAARREDVATREYVQVGRPAELPAAVAGHG